MVHWKWQLVHWKCLVEVLHSFSQVAVSWFIISFLSFFFGLTFLSVFLSFFLSFFLFLAAQSDVCCFCCSVWCVVSAALSDVLFLLLCLMCCFCCSVWCVVSAALSDVLFLLLLMCCFCCSVWCVVSAVLSDVLFLLLCLMCCFCCSVWCVVSAAQSDVLLMQLDNFDRSVEPRPQHADHQQCSVWHAGPGGRVDEHDEQLHVRLLQEICKYVVPGLSYGLRGDWVGVGLGGVEVYVVPGLSYGWEKGE